MSTSPMGFDPQEFFYALHAAYPFTDDAITLYQHLAKPAVATGKSLIEASNQQQLAKSIGLTRESLLEASKELRERGLVSLWASERPTGHIGLCLSMPTNAFPGIEIPGHLLALEVSWSARLVLAEIVGLWGVWGTAFMSDSYFSKRLRLGERTVRAAIKGLVTSGLLHCDTQQSRTPKRILTPGPRY